MVILPVRAMLKMLFTLFFFMSQYLATNILKFSYIKNYLLIKTNEDDFDRGKGKYILRDFIEKKRIIIYDN